MGRDVEGEMCDCGVKAVSRGGGRVGKEKGKRKQKENREKIFRGKIKVKRQGEQIEEEKKRRDKKKQKREREKEKEERDRGYKPKTLMSRHQDTLWKEYQRGSRELQGLSQKYRDWEDPIVSKREKKRQGWHIEGVLATINTQQVNEQATKQCAIMMEKSCT